MKTKTIPLKNAMILCDHKTKEVMVVNHPNIHNEGNHLPMSYGACWKEWKEASTEDLLSRLYRLAVRLSIDWDIPMEFIEKEFLNIPEYKKHMNQFSVFLCEGGKRPLLF